MQMHTLQLKVGTVSCGLIIALGFCSPGNAQAQVFNQNVQITTSDPKITFEDNSQPTLFAWLMSANFVDFSIGDATNGTQPFSILAGAPDNSFVVSSTGQIGLGAYAQTEVHVTRGNPVTLRMEDAGPVPATWDVEGGGLGFNIKDFGAGTTPFSILPGAPSNSLFVAANGRVGMGTATPAADSRLDIRSGLINGVLLKRATPDPHYLRIENSAGVFRTGVQGNGHAQFGMLTPGKGLFLTAGGTGKMEINASGQFSFGNPPPTITTHAMVTSTGALLTTGGVWTNNSSRAAKQDIEPITSEEAREAVRALQPVGYRYKAELDERYVGFIAEDVPDLVATRDHKGLAPMDIVGVLTKVVQDQDKQLDQQRQELGQQQTVIAQQQKLLEALNQRLMALEQK